MENKVSLESVIYFAVKEIEEREYEERPSLKELNNQQETSEFHNEKIEQILKKENKAERIIKFNKSISKVAVIFFVSFSVLSMTFLTVEAVRDSVATALIEWKDKFVSVFVLEETEKENIGEIEFGYITNEYYLEYSDTELENLNMFIYTDGKGNYISISVSISDDRFNINMDNENGVIYHNIVIDNSNGIWAENNGYNMLIVARDGMTYSIDGYISLNEIIKIFSNINIL